MRPHKFKVGDIVALNPAVSRFVPGGVYEVIKHLPGNGEYEYRIKSANETHERVARESELTKTYATKAENCLRDTSGRRAKSLERRIGAEAIRRIITACRSGRMAAGAIGGISENAPTRLSPAYEAEEPSALR